MKTCAELLQDQFDINNALAARGDVELIVTIQQNELDDLEKVATLMTTILLRQLMEGPMDRTLNIALDTSIHSNNDDSMYEWVLEWLLENQPIDLDNLQTTMTDLTDDLHRDLVKATRTGMYCPPQSSFFDEDSFQ
jgi:hypothetical protein